MPIDDQTLLDLLELQGTPVGVRTPFCPDDESMASYFERRLPQRQHETVTRHLADCRYCRGRLGMLRRLQEPRPHQAVSEAFKARAKQLAGSNPKTRWKQAPLWAAAATIVLAVGVWIGQSNAPSIPPVALPDMRELRSVDAGALEPRILSPAEGASVEAAGLQIRWTPVAGSLHYELYVMSVAGDLLVHQKTEDTHWRAASPLPMEPGREYFVRVDAHLEDATTVSTEHVLFAVKDSD